MKKTHAGRNDLPLASICFFGIGNSMNVHLSPALASFVTSGVRDGLFTSVDAAVEQGLELLRRQKELKISFSAANESELLSKLNAGIASLDSGRGIPASEAFALLRAQNG